MVGMGHGLRSSDVKVCQDAVSGLSISGKVNTGIGGTYLQERDAISIDFLSHVLIKPIQIRFKPQFR